MSQPSISGSTGYVSEQFFTLYFDVALDAANLPPTSAFSVAINGTGTTVSAVDVDSASKSVRLTFTGSALTAGDIIEFAYTDPTVGNDVNALQGIDGTDAATFTSSAVVFGGRPGPSAPTAPSLDPASDSGVTGDGITNRTAPTLDGTADPNATVRLYDSDGTTLLGTTTADGSGQWSIVASTLAEGVHRLMVTQTDASSNISPLSSALDLTIDITPPATPVAGPSLASASDSGMQGDSITNVTTPAVTGTVTPGSTVRLYDTDGTTLLGTGVADDSGAYGITASTLGAGVHSLTVQTTDRAGNLSAASPALDLTIDTTAPVAPEITSPTLTNSAAPMLTGTAESGATVTVTVAGATYTMTAIDGQWTLDLATATPGSGSLALDLNGANTVTASAADPAGNLSAASPALDLTIDTTAPVAPTLSQTTPVTGPAAPVLDGSAEPGSTVRLSQDGTVIVTLPALDGTWTYTYPGSLAAGTYVLDATATDAAGNESAASSSLTLLVEADRSYALVTPIPGTDTTRSFIYDPAGALSTVVTKSSQGQVLTSVTDSSAVINIFDDSGVLIGTITQPSTSLFSEPIFATSPQAAAATTDSGPADSVIDLLGETHTLLSRGNDQIVLHAGAATITAIGPSALVNDIEGDLTFYGSANGTAEVYGNSGRVTALGGGAGGVLIGGTAGDNILAAAGGTTTLIGAGDGDTLFGSPNGLDTLFGGAGAEILVGGGGTETLVATPDDVAFGGSGNSTLFAGEAGGSILVGGSGNSVLVAGQGDATLWGGTGHSTLWAGAGHDVLGGNADINSVTIMVGGSSDTVFIGSGGTSTAYGGAGHNTFWTGTGSMNIIGGSGEDTIMLGSGTTSVAGGTAHDLYGLIAGSAGGTTTIGNFKVGNDQIAFYGYDPTTVSRQVSGGNMVLTADDHSTITLLGVTQLDPNSIVSI